MKLLRIEPQLNKEGLPEKYDVYYYNGVYLGDIICHEDGSWMYWPDQSRSGGWNWGALLQLAEALREINAPFEQSVRDFFDEIENYTPKYEPDDGPFTQEQIDMIRELANRDK